MMVVPMYLSWLITLGDVRSAVATTRPPIELGDPDGSGKPGDGPKGASKILQSGVTTPAQKGLWLTSIRGLFALWMWSRVMTLPRR